MITRRQFGMLSGASAFLLTTRAQATSKVASKRGFCLTGRRPERLRRRVALLQPAWLYSWGHQRPTGLAPEVEFTPMLWGAGAADKRAEILSDVKRRYENNEVHHLLGFNEPDQHNQSNITVARALDLWPELMEVGVPLVSPACVHPDKQWMREFFDGVERKGLRVDAVAVHSYAGPNVKALIAKLHEVHRMYSRPLWITELAVGDWKAKTAAENRHSPERIAAFLRELLPALDNLPFVHRYAWFSAAPHSAPLGTSALFDEAGGLSKLGTIYASSS